MVNTKNYTDKLSEFHIKKEEAQLRQNEMLDAGKYKGDFSRARGYVFGTKEQESIAKTDKMFKPVTLISKNVVKVANGQKKKSDGMASIGDMKTTKRFSYERKL